MTYLASGSYRAIDQNTDNGRITMDYDEAAAAIPPTVFYRLRQAPTPLTVDLEGSHHEVAAKDLSCTAIAFAPGDRTLYTVVIATDTARKMAVVTVANMNLAFAVPWHDGAYVHPSYLEGQVRGGTNPVTCEAVAAVVNRAIRCCYDEATV